MSRARPSTGRIRRCRVCGCTGSTACPGGCYWAGADICSACARVERGVDAMPAPAPGMERLACGCLIGNVGDAFVIEPCSGRCDMFIYAVRNSALAGKPIETLDASDVGI